MGALARAEMPNEAEGGEEAASVEPAIGLSRPEPSDMYDPGDAAGGSDTAGGSDAALSSFGSTDGITPADDADRAAAVIAVRPFVGDAAAFLLAFRAGVAGISVFTTVFFVAGFFATAFFANDLLLAAVDFLSAGFLMADFFAVALFVLLPGSKAGGGVDVASTEAHGEEENGRSASMSMADVIFFELEMAHGGFSTAIPAASCCAEDRRHGEGNDWGSYGLKERRYDKQNAAHGDMC